MPICGECCCQRNRMFRGSECWGRRVKPLAHLKSYTLLRELEGARQSLAQLADVGQFCPRSRSDAPGSEVWPVKGSTTQRICLLVHFKDRFDGRVYFYGLPILHSWLIFVLPNTIHRCLNKHAWARDVLHIFHAPIDTN